MVHRPKIITTQDGCASPTATKTYKRLKDGTIILTEVWNDMAEDWKEGDIVIARPGYKWVSKWQAGKPYVLVRFYSDKEALIGIYCDVCHPVRQNEGGMEYLDLYLDVWKESGREEPEVLDEDELQEALRQGYVNDVDYDFAHTVADELITKIMNDSPELQF